MADGWITKKAVEYEVRPIDANGDAIDVHPFRNKGQAIKFAREYPIGSEAAAVVVERCTTHYQHDTTGYGDDEVGEREYDAPILTIGSMDAVKKWAGSDLVESD
jgi:hypothetical protein